MTVICYGGCVAGVIVVVGTILKFRKRVRHVSPQTVNNILVVNYDDRGYAEYVAQRRRAYPVN